MSCLAHCVRRTIPPAAFDAVANGRSPIGYDAEKRANTDSGHCAATVGHAGDAGKPRGFACDGLG